MCTFGNFLAPVLVAAHTVNNLHIGDEQDLENEGYESVKKKNLGFFVYTKELFFLCKSVGCDHHRQV